jgi:hypothetical protein
MKEVFEQGRNQCQIAYELGPIARESKSIKSSVLYSIKGKFPYEINDEKVQQIQLGKFRKARWQGRIPNITLEGSKQEIQINEFHLKDIKKSNN